MFSHGNWEMENVAHLHLRRPRDRHDVLSLREEPRQRNLPRARVVALADLLQPVCELDDVGEVLLRVAVTPSPVAVSF